MVSARIRAVAVLLSGFALFATGQAQITTDKGTQSDKINEEIHKLDLLVKLEPLALRKEQYPDLLAGMEKAMDREKDELSLEDDELIKMEPEITAAIDNAVEKGQYPPRDTQDDIAGRLQKLQSKRIIVGAQMVNDVWGAIQTKLNAGQRKIMANSFAPSMINSQMKPEDLTDDIKIRFYVHTVILDPLAYPILVEMAKHAS